MKAKKKTGLGGKGTRTARIEAAAATGAVAGVAAGSIAGPPGMIAGGVVGAVAGAAAGVAVEDAAERRHAHRDQIDREIGVTGGDLGAAPPDQPPARVGAFSTGSAGATAPTHTASEGPIQDLDD